MFTKTLVAIAVAVPVFAASGAANADSLVYNGGPKGTVTTRVATPTFEVGKPYAQVPASTVRANKHIYSGGPKGMAVHER